MSATDWRWKMSGVCALVAMAVTTAACRNRAGADPTETRNRQFERSLSGATLVGHSTQDGRSGISKEERYQIQKVTRLAGNTWLFHARIRYGSHDVTVPIPVPIQWAGDTPVIALNTLDIPGLGRYSARVILDGDRYAGTWNAKDHGGELFGKIVHDPSH